MDFYGLTAASTVVGGIQWSAQENRPCWSVKSNRHANTSTGTWNSSCVFCSDGYGISGCVPPLPRPHSAPSPIPRNSSMPPWAPRGLAPGAVPDGYWTLGSLGPAHTHTSQWKVQKEKRLRQKAFGEAVSSVHGLGRGSVEFIGLKKKPLPKTRQQEQGETLCINRIEWNLNDTLREHICAVDVEGEGGSLITRALQRDTAKACALK